MKRIRKDQARKRYNNNEVVFVVPCRIDPYNVWGIGGIIKNDPEDPYTTFDTTVNAFEYYNCRNETGRYTAFYIPEV